MAEKLKNTNGSFEMVGRINLGLDKFASDTSDSGYVWSRFQTTVNCGDTRPFITAMGGYMGGNPYPLKFWDNGSEFEVDWDDRFEENIVKKVPNFSKITLAVEKDESGKLIYEDFLSWYDAIDKLKEVYEDDTQEFKDGTIVKVRGNLKFKEYQDKTQYDLEINKIFITEAEEEDFHATFKQVILTDKDSLIKDRLREDKEVDIMASIIGYDSNEKKSRPFKNRFVVALSDFKKKETFEKMLKLLSAKTKEVTEIEVVGEIIRSSSLRNATVDDYSQDVLDFYDEDDIDELLEEKINDGGDGGNYLKITKPATRMDKDKKKKSFHRVTDSYKLEDLIFVKSESDVENIDDMLDGELELDDFELDLEI